MADFNMNNIVGFLHTYDISVEDKRLCFSWDYAEQWLDEGDINKYLGGKRKSTRVDKIELSDVSIVCWNKNRGTITSKVDVSNALGGRIEFFDWFDKLSVFYRNTEYLQAYFLLSGIDANGNEVGYIIGGDDNCSGFFEDKNRVEYLKKATQTAYIIKQAAGDRKQWVFLLVGLHKYVDTLVKLKIAKKVYISVNDVKWEKRKLSIVYESGNELKSKLEDAQNAIIQNNNLGTTELLGVNYIGDNTLSISEKLCDLAKKQFSQVQKKFRLSLYPIVFEDEKVIVYNLNVAENKRRATKYNNENRYFSYITECIDDTKSIALMPYDSLQKQFKIIVKDERESLSEIYTGKMTNVGVRKNKLNIKFEYPNTEYKLKRVSMVLRSDVTEKTYAFSVKTQARNSKIVVKASICLDEIEWEQFYWDIKVFVEKDGKEYELFVRNYSKFFRLKNLFKNMQYVLPDDEYVVFPYATNSCGFAVTYRRKSPQDNRAFVRKEYLALFLYYLLLPYWRLKNIWLVYEKYSITAQDNSLYFFKYCMEKLSEKEKKHIYYVIDKNADDFKYVEPYGDRVIDFLSLKHMIYLKAASLLISSDTKAHSYAWHSPASLYRFMVKWKKNVFLQHGVIYYKQCHKGLKKNGTNECDLFIVSSEVEKKIILDNFGYSANEIAVTGLGRWDVLRDKSDDKEKMILVMPTWRSWLEEATKETFEESDYYKKYMEFLNYECLHEFLKEKKVNLVFYIHPKFREYISAFSTQSPYIKMIEFGSEPLNEIIMKCNMMITDYSSACWDVYYQGKPVLFYIFDFEMYNEVQGSYVDMRTDAFGDVTDNMPELLEAIKYYEANGFKEKEKYADMREELLPYIDDKNCDRIYDSIMSKFYPRKYKNMKKGEGK